MFQTRRGEWNHYKIAFIEDRITIELNGELVNDWKAFPKGKVKDFSDEGYIGIQNHDWDTTVSFKNILIKEHIAYGKKRLFAL
jgi:Domain of Unknown Function (DUF1080).